jgi:hypothetical protein
LGAVATVAAVIITHVLNQRTGEKRADQVKEELIGRISALDTRVTEAKEVFGKSIDKLSDQVEKVGAEASSQIAQVRSEMRSEIANSTDAVKEYVSAEVRVVSADMRTMKAEILARLPERTRTASSEPIG